jgi:hypothetical protein
MSETFPNGPAVAKELHIHPGCQKVVIVYTDNRAENFHGIDNLKRTRVAATSSSSGADCDLELTDANGHVVNMIVQPGIKVRSY